MTKVHFKDFFIADQLTSLSIVFKTFCAAIMCFGEDRFGDSNAEIKCEANKMWFFPIITCLPLLWRFLQCIRRFYNAKKAFPNLVNALKYFVGLMVVLFGTLNTHYGKSFAIASLIFQIISTLFSFTWDLFMDWGLGDRNSKNYLLRDRLMYPSKAFYYFAVFSNLFLRFCWVISHSKVIIHHSIVLTMILGVLEVYR